MSLVKYLISVLFLVFAFSSVNASESTSNVESEMVTDSVQPAIETVNINTASAEEIASKLKGVGMSKAQAMVNYRESHGAFVSLEDMTQVKGIGKATVEKNRNKITL